MLAISPKSLARRFVIYVVATSTAITILTSAYQLYADYLCDLAEIETQLDELRQTRLSVLPHHLLTYDEEGLHIAIQSILALNSIEYVEVRDNNEFVIAVGDDAAEAIRQEIYPLYHSSGNGGSSIGSITVHVSLKGVYQHIYDQALIIIISNGIKTFIVSTIILLVFFQLIGRHLIAIGDFATKYRPDLSGKKLKLDRKDTISNKGDELDILVTAMGHMQDRINTASQDSIAREEAEKALRLSDKRFRDYAESSSNWFWEMDEELKFSYGSERFREITGINPEDVYGYTRWKLIDEQLENPASEKWQKHFLQMENREPFRDFQYRLMNHPGEVIHISLSGNPIYNTDGDFLGYRGSGTDITKRKQAEEQLVYQACHDGLTGLISRYELERRASRLLYSISKKHAEHAMCFLDLDQFKVINDTCGHAAGDELLRQLGRLLQDTIRPQDTLARLGGDEFGVLMGNCTLKQARHIADKILKTITDYQFQWEGNVFRIGVSMGLVAITKSTGNFTDLLKQADAACYLAKDLGRNRIHVYHPDDTELAIRHGEMQWVGRISQALDDNRFCLYAQPIEPLEDDGRRHYELLIRMLDEHGDIILPGAFLPAAEHYNLIEKIDYWVVENTCTSLAEHPAFVEQINFISINLSGPSLTNPDILKSILHNFEAFGVPPGKVCFEVTETVAISNLNSAINFINRLKKSGFRFALDDFGSGISSFGYLKYLPVDFLKIDGMFVRGIADDPIDYAMVKSINEIGQVMGMKTIAEFVENEEVKLMLKNINVSYVQGYAIGRPQPLVDTITQG
ncbi:MAG: EAL domain-containing protein [Gammaproteobacteria bacterium]|nr:EAL domain-containing protein [Gammaproteobacteria bacterium]